jgi:hypothetical protein
MARNPWPAAHGHRAELGGVTASETCPSDELPSATGADTDGRDRDDHGHFALGNGIARAKRVRPGPRGALAVLEASGDAAARAAVRWGRRYGAHRRAELAQAHCGLSAGVSTIIESAADLMADARYWRARGVAEGNPEHYRLAAQLMAQARGCERDAWELASREAVARKQSQSDSTHGRLVEAFGKSSGGAP